MHVARILKVIVLASTLGSGCRTAPAGIETTLYFGLSKPDGSLVADSSWKRFEREEMLPVFPNGFTVFSAQGVWNGSTGVVSESSKVVVFIHPKDALLSTRIDSMRMRYKMQFKQDAVLRTDRYLYRLDF